MQNLNKILGIIIIATGIFGLIYIELTADTPAHAPIETETNSQNSVIEPIKAEKKPDTPSFEPIKTKTTNTTSVQKPMEGTSDIKTPSTQAYCISQTQFNQDPRHRIINDFIRQDYLNSEIDYINYLNNQELEELAFDGNVKAMYILGMNYRWNAIYQSDRAERFRPQEIEKQPIVPRKEFNQQSWQKAHQWLEKAAINGQVVALMEIAVGYQQQAYFLEEQDEVSDKVINSLRQNALVYMQLHQQLAPELSDHANIQNLIDALQPADDKLLSLLKRRWKNEREALGLSETLDLNLPAEIAQLEQLKDTICEQNDKE